MSIPNIFYNNLLYNLNYTKSITILTNFNVFDTYQNYFVDNIHSNIVACISF